MPKLTYLLINTENMGHSTPMAVSGYSGKLYGHAEFDPKYGAHTVRVPAEKYEGDMDLDIAKGMHRRLQRWKIRAEGEAVSAEAVDVFETLALRAAQRFDKDKFAKDASPEICAAHDRACGEFTQNLLRESGKADTADWLDRFYGEGSYSTETPSISSVVPPMDQLPPPADGPQSEFDGPPPTVPLPELNLHPKILEKMVREENDKGANIVIEGERTKVKLRAALAEHFAKQAA